MKELQNEKLYFEMTFSLPSSSSLLEVPNAASWYTDDTGHSCDGKKY